MYSGSKQANLECLSVKMCKYCKYCKCDNCVRGFQPTFRRSNNARCDTAFQAAVISQFSRYFLCQKSNYLKRLRYNEQICKWLPTLALKISFWLNLSCDIASMWIDIYFLVISRSVPLIFQRNWLTTLAFLWPWFSIIPVIHRNIRGFSSLNALIANFGKKLIMLKFCFKGRLGWEGFRHNTMQISTYWCFFHEGYFYT